MISSFLIRFETKLIRKQKVDMVFFQTENYLLHHYEYFLKVISYQLMIFQKIHW